MSVFNKLFGFVWMLLGKECIVLCKVLIIFFLGMVLFVLLLLFVWLFFVDES